MNYTEVKALRTERVKLHEQAADILKAAAARDKGERDLTTEEEEQFDKIHADIDKLGKQIEREERQMVAASQIADDPLAQSAGRLVPPVDGEGDMGPDPEEYRLLGPGRSDVINRWARGGLSALSPAERQFYKAEGGHTQRTLDIPLFASQPHGEQIEVRAQSVGTNSEGGFTVPEGFFNSLTAALLAFGGVRNSRATIIRTDSGNDLPMPTVDDTSNTGELLGENVEVNEQDIVFSRVVLNAYKYSSKGVRVPTELEEDSAFDIGAWIGRLLGERLGRITNAHQTTGTGTAQPNGFVTASTEGIQVALTTAFTYEEMIQLKHSVDPAYRIGAEWGMNDSTLSSLKRIMTTDGLPVWRPDVTVGEPDTLDGDRLFISQDMASIAADAKVMTYGDMSLYHIREVRGVRLLRLVERYAEFDQIGYFAFLRMDADLLNAGTNPIKHMAMAS
jgi:HK97 family phage major capsid protein